MGFSDKDKILIKNLHDSKGYRRYGAKKANERVSFKKLDQGECYAASCLLETNPYCG